ncbi:MAG: acylamino acid-releasing protein [Pedobacter sp.]|nr:MAG: acylamino acid-releasing protein [Pedobacter sp.]
MKKLVILLVLIPFISFSQEYLIKNNAVKKVNSLWDLTALSNKPKVVWTDQNSPVHRLLYSSVDYEGKPTQVFAYYSNPDLLNGRPGGKVKFPGVVLVHGGGGKAYKEWVEKWAAKGYAAIAMDLSGNDDTGKKLPQAGPDQDDSFKFPKIAKGELKDVWTYHAISSVILAHSLLLSFPEVDPDKTGITGISWGGYLTCIAAGLDTRFKVAVPVYGCGYYDESEPFGKMLDMLSNTDKQKWMQYFDPSVYLPFAKSRFLFVNGNKDSHYNVVPYHKTYLQVKKDKRTICIKPDMIHSHAHGWEPEEIQHFFEQELRDVKPLIKIKQLNIQGVSINLSYQSPLSLTQAEFYYSNDTTSANAARVWLKETAVIDAKKSRVTIIKPKGGFKYGFFYLKDARNISVSSEFIIN